jgi:hypothetical protein
MYEVLLLTLKVTLGWFALSLLCLVGWTLLARVSVAYRPRTHLGSAGRLSLADLE